MTKICRFKDEWLIRALTGVKGADEAFLSKMRAVKTTYLSHALLDAGFLTAEQLGKVIEHAFKVKYLPLTPKNADKFGLTLVNEKLCRKYSMLPTGVSEGEIHMAMANPLDHHAQADVEAVTGRRVIPLFSLPRDVDACMERVFSADNLVYDLLSKVEPSEDVQIVGRTYAPKVDDDTIVTAPVVMLANSIISQAHRRRSSDIHIEHEEKSSHVRIRVDGVLKNIMTLPRRLAAGPLVSRIKIMADLDVSDHMRPQDGRTKIRIGGAEIGLRVSTLPTSYGEKVVIRILDQRAAEVPFEKLGFAPEVSAAIAATLEAPQGMILVTGPTGSGKTTTLYSMLNKIRSERTNIVTAEDPIEYKLAGINQVQVNEKQGLTFSSVLRSVLRQDPDIIMVGEIRDTETANIAFQAAMTGHLVISTLHTNDAVSTLARLSDMGVDRFKIAPSLLAVTAQRLVRRLCSACAEKVPEAKADKEIIEALGRYGFEKVIYKAAGCGSCEGSGYAGRTSLVEILLVTPGVKALIGSGAAPGEITRTAITDRALRTLTHDALWHLSKGHTDLAEILPYITLEKAAPEPAPHEPTHGHYADRRKPAQYPHTDRRRPAQHEPPPPAVMPPQPVVPAAPEVIPAQVPEIDHRRAAHGAIPPQPVVPPAPRIIPPPIPAPAHRKTAHTPAPHASPAAPRTAANHKPAHQAPSHAHSSRKKRVLIAEDYALLRKLVKKFLEDAGFEVFEAEDGEEALQAITSGPRPDILVTDINMPRINGHALVKDVRQKLGILDMPIIILTTESSDRSQALAFKLGADDYMIKPFKAPLLVARINAALRRSGKLKKPQPNA